MYLKRLNCHSINLNFKNIFYQLKSNESNTDKFTILRFKLRGCINGILYFFKCFELV